MTQLEPGTDEHLVLRSPAMIDVVGDDSEASCHLASCLPLNNCRLTSLDNSSARRKAASSHMLHDMIAAGCA